MTAHKEVVVMLLVAGTSFIVNMAFGFLAGMILSYYWKFNSHDYIKKEFHG